MTMSSGTKTDRDGRASRHEDVRRDEAVVREPIGIGQVVAFLIGMANVIVGAIGLIRTGASDLTGSTTQVAGLEMTGALAIAHLFLGLIVLAGAGIRSAAVSGLLVGGSILVAAGVIALAQDVSWLGWTRANGIAYLVAGGAALLAGLLTPSRTVVENRTVTIRD